MNVHSLWQVKVNIPEIFVLCFQSGVLGAFDNPRLNIFPLSPHPVTFHLEVWLHGRLMELELTNQLSGIILISEMALVSAEE